MRFLIIGGSGRTGKLVIEDILKRGHQVTALVRNPTSLEKRTGLDVVKGTRSFLSDSLFQLTRNRYTPCNI